MRKIFVTMLLSVLMLLSCINTVLAAGTTTSAETITSVTAAGNSISSAESVSMDKQYSGSITASQTSAYYKFKLSKSGTVNLNSMASIEKICYELLDSNGTSMWNSTATKNNSLGVVSFNQDLCLTSGTYYVVLKQTDSYTGNYQFTLSFTSANESFAETPGGTNNTMGTAPDISFAEDYIGQLAINDNCDYYKLTVPTSGQIDLSITWKTPHIYYGIYTPEGERLWYNSNVMDGGFWGNGGDNNHTMHVVAGTYYFGVEGDPGNYNFLLTFSSAKESFKENNTGTNDNTLLDANKISLGKTYRGQIASNDNIDFYQFTVPKKMTVKVKATAERSLDFEVYNNNGTSLMKAGNYTTVDKKLDLEAGTYYFSVDGNYPYNTGDYSFSIYEYKLDTPVLKAVKNSSTGMTITWKSVTDAAGYKIYRKNSGSWSEVGSVSGINTTSYTDTTVKSGKTYTYTVAAFNPDLISNYNTKGLSLKYLSMPTVTLTNSSKGIIVSWKKVAGASGYYVDCKISGKWKTVKTIKDSDVKSYTYTKVKNGSSYSFRVRAFSGKAVSAASSTTKAIRVTGVSMKTPKNVAYQRLELNWEKNSKAAGYEIQYGTSKSFKGASTRRYSGANSTSCVITGLTKGKTYYVRVRVYTADSSGKWYYSAWSSAKSIKITK
ncbi:MAG: fibronectin type III domain-containing protein [Clostridiales bacterium]|nr:fibronectin type III domain-containing protein [Clostridiales bacterium]